MRSSRVLVPAFAALVLTVSACTAAPAELTDRPTAGSPTPVPTQTAQSSDPTPTPSPSAPTALRVQRPTSAPTQKIDAGTVSDGNAVAVSGEGDAEVTYTTDGELAVVLAFDCSDCAGPTFLTGPGRSQPWGESAGALNGNFLRDVFVDDDPAQSLWVVAEGEWSLDLLSWNDLPLVDGPVSHEGSTVIYLTGDEPRSEVSWVPANDDDVFAARFFGEAKSDAVMFGFHEATTEIMELGRPGVIAVTTDGQWSLTPVQ